ncbi:MAG: hypothetical protein A2033_04150 [Bacteroidetes bacterium GWA2_31_9]|nr:MAG: hypothetical protein A2033_04150 [Bacteroidetes bacterium GWA2_31_9]
MRFFKNFLCIINSNIQFIEKKEKYIFHIIANSFFLFLFLLSFFYYKERTVNFDTAYYVFKMIYFNDFNIELNRWIAYPSQILPLIAIKNGAILSTVLKLYSISFILTYYLIYCFIAYSLKNKPAVYALILTLCLTYRNNFYFATIDLPLTLAISILFWALISQRTYTNINRLLFIQAGAIFCIIVNTYGHLLSIIAILFIIAFEIIFNNRWKERPIIFILLFTISWYFIRVYVLPLSEYDKSKMLSLEVLFNKIPTIFSLKSTNYFVNFFLYEIWIVPVLFVINLFLAIKKQLWTLTFLLISFPVCYLSLILTSWYKGESPIVYQGYYAILGLYIAVAFIAIMSKYYNKSIIIISVTLILIISSTSLYSSHKMLTNRIEYFDRMAKYMRKINVRKGLIEPKNLPWNILHSSWAIPFESLLMSSLDDPDSAVTFNSHHHKDLNKINVNGLFLGANFKLYWDSDSINKSYFNLPKYGYKYINTHQSEIITNDSIFNKNQINIEPISNEYYCDNDSIVVIPIKIINKSSIKINSITTSNYSLLLSYHLYSKDGELICYAGEKTFLEIDIEKNTSATVGLKIRLPKSSGLFNKNKDYVIVEADILCENIRWLEINKRFKLYF